MINVSIVSSNENICDLNADFIICNDNQTIDETLQIMQGFLKCTQNKTPQELHLVERRWQALVNGEKVSTYRLNEGFFHKGFLIYKDFPKEEKREVVYATNVFYGPFNWVMELDGFDEHTPDLETGLKQMQVHYPEMRMDTDILLVKHLSGPEKKKRFPKEVKQILKEIK